ncbi:MAG: hypothetical protein Q4D19_08010 [Lautropia sp.]|nr:hypothetical protein [Lautropia sp.]
MASIGIIIQTAQFPEVDLMSTRLCGAGQGGTHESVRVAFGALPVASSRAFSRFAGWALCQLLFQRAQAQSGPWLIVGMAGRFGEFHSPKASVVPRKNRSHPIKGL